MNRVSVGMVAVETPCPRCQQLEVITVDLSPVLTTPGEGVATLRVKAASKALEHWCSTVESAATLFDDTDADQRP